MMQKLGPLPSRLRAKRARFTFPDDFTKLVRKLQKRLEEKHHRESIEGRPPPSTWISSPLARRHDDTRDRRSFLERFRIPPGCDK